MLARCHASVPTQTTQENAHEEDLEGPARDLEEALSRQGNAEAARRRGRQPHHGQGYLHDLHVLLLAPRAGSSATTNREEASIMKRHAKDRPGAAGKRLGFEKETLR